MTYYIGQNELSAVRRVLRTGVLERYVAPSDSAVNFFEQNFSKYMGVPKCLAVNSGTSALICCLRALGVGYGDEVIMPSHTYVATALAIISVGAKPLIVDIDDSLTIDIEALQQVVTKNTKAIIPVHMHGLPCDMNAIMLFAKKNKLFVIEDVAQACGGSYEGKRLGSFGNISAFSFNHYKMISSGEGGAIITNDDNLHTSACVIHHGGIQFENSLDKDFSSSSSLGTNYRLSEIAGAILVEQLKRLEGFILKLKRNKKYLADKLQKTGALKVQLNPIFDGKGDCGRVLFFKFKDPKNAMDFLNLCMGTKIPAFSPYSKGHFAGFWINIFNKFPLLVPKGSDTLAFEKMNFKQTWQKSEAVLRSTVGVTIKYEWRAKDIDHISKEILNLLNRVHGD